MRGRKWGYLARSGRVTAIAVTDVGNRALHSSLQYHRSHCMMNDGPSSSLAGQTQGSPFLKLPGELRNRIYDFCAEDGAVNLPASRSSFGQLRYVCRFLYIEFSPLYLARTAVVLQPVDLERYVAAFYPGLQLKEGSTPDMPTRASKLPGRIRIDTPLGSTIDLSSLAHLRPNKLQFTLVRGNCTNEPLQEASDLLQTLTDSSYSAPFRKVIEIVLLRYSLTPEIVFKMRRGSTESIPGQTTPNTYDFHIASWLTQHGLPSLRTVKIVLESSEEVLRFPVANIARARHSRGRVELRPLDELDGGDSQETFLTVQLADLNLSQPSSKSGLSRNPTTSSESGSNL